MQPASIAIAIKIKPKPFIRGKIVPDFLGTNRQYSVAISPTIILIPIEISPEQIAFHDHISSVPASKKAPIVIYNKPSISQPNPKPINNSIGISVCSK